MVSGKRTLPGYPALLVESAEATAVCVRAAVALGIAGCGSIGTSGLETSSPQRWLRGSYAKDSKEWSQTKIYGSHDRVAPIDWEDLPRDV